MPPGSTKVVVDEPVGEVVRDTKVVVDGLAVEALLDTRVGWLEQMQLAMHAVYAERPLNPGWRRRCDERKLEDAPLTSHRGMYLETCQVRSATVV